MVIRISNCTSSNNGRDGVRIEGNPHVEIKGLATSWNGGEGLNIIQNQKSALAEKRWFEKPLGILLLGLFVAVGGGGILKYLGWL